MVRDSIAFRNGKISVDAFDSDMETRFLDAIDDPDSPSDGIKANPFF